MEVGYTKRLTFFRLPKLDKINTLSCGYHDYKVSLFIIALLRIYHFAFSKLNDGGWIYLSTCFYGQHIAGTNSLAKVMTLLSEKGLIYKNDSYSKGNYSRSYKLHEDLLNCEWEKADFCESVKAFTGRSCNTDTWARLQEHLSGWESLGDDNPIKKLGEYVEDILKSTTLIERDREPEIIAEATRAQEENVREHQEKVDFINFKNKIREAKGQRLLSIPKLETTVESIAAGYRATLNAFSNDAEKYVKFHLDKNGKSGTNRLYSNVTNLKSIWRPDLRIDGDELFNIDIRCSQPCLMSVLYGNSPADLREKELFIQFVTEKDFYGELAANAPPGVTLSRAEAKGQTFILMFAPNQTMSKQPLFKSFEMFFPILAAKIKEIKRNDYKKLSFILQCTESDIMVLGVMNELMERGIRALSIHDSILCKEQDIPVVKEIISRHFESVTGFKPVLKI